MLEKLKNAATESVLETHPHYRTAIGVLGVLLPIMMILSSLLAGEAIRNSISAYYYGTARDWFVGTLWVLGVFLFFYRFRPYQPSAPKQQLESIRSGALDSWLGKAAGIAAVIVSLLPTTPPEGSPTQPPEIGKAHGISAGILFICLSLFPLVLFSQSRKRKRVYQIIGWTMIGLMLLVALYAFAPENLREALAPWRPILVVETLLVWAFGFSWFEKGRELAAEQKKTSHADTSRKAA
jgi:hypothetical protein